MPYMPKLGPWAIVAGVTVGCASSSQQPPQPAPGAAPVVSPVAAIVDAATCLSESDVAAVMYVGIKPNDDTHYDLDSALASVVAAYPNEFIGGVRTIAAIKDGEPHGIKVFGVKARSVYARLGLHNGDTVLSVNGAAAYEKDSVLIDALQTASLRTVQLERRGKPLTLEYAISGQTTRSPESRIPPLCPVATTGPADADIESNNADAPVPSPASDDSATNAGVVAGIVAGIQKIDDTHYEIDRAALDAVLVNPMALAKGARVVAAVKNGNPDGFKIYAIRPTSVYAALGLSNGDTLHEINGFQLTSIDKALEMYTKLNEANSLQVQVTRRGKPVTLNYTIR